MSGSQITDRGKLSFCSVARLQVLSNIKALLSEEEFMLWLPSILALFIFYTGTIVAWEGSTAWAPCTYCEYMTDIIE